MDGVERKLSSVTAKHVYLHVRLPHTVGGSVGRTESVNTDALHEVRRAALQANIDALD